MKKTIITSMALASFAMGVLLYSCTKEKIIQPQNSINEVGVYENENGKFKKEIVVTDESGNNSLFLSISSDNESSVTEYISNNEFKLGIEKKEIIETIKQNVSKNKSGNDGKQPAVVDNKNSIHIEVVTSNLEKNVDAYSLEVNPKKRKNGMSTLAWNAEVEYITASDWIGIVQFPTVWGYMSYDLKVAFSFKNNKLSSWSYYKQGYMNETQYWHEYMDLPSTWKTRIEVATDTRQVTTNYKVVFARADFRGRSCPIGSYDGQNCYVGAPPSGTTAFVSGNFFYYTAIPGATTPETKCPMAGSVWDGDYCRAIQIPSGTTSFNMKQCGMHNLAS